MLLSSSRPSPLLYRTLLHLSHGAAIALAVPTYEDLVLPMERHVYWAQHLLLLAVPLYLVLFEDDGCFHLPRTWSWRHCMLAYGAWCFYHFAVMQAAALATLSNVGHMLCPAETDPFADWAPSYLVVGVGHQLAATVASGAAAVAVRRVADWVTGEGGVAEAEAEGAGQSWNNNVKGVSQRRGEERRGGGVGKCPQVSCSTPCVPPNEEIVSLSLSPPLTTTSTTSTTRWMTASPSSGTTGG